MENMKRISYVLKRFRMRFQRSILVVFGPDGLNKVPTLYKLVARNKKLRVLWYSNDHEDISKIGWQTTEDCNVTHCKYSEIEKIEHDMFYFVVVRDIEDHMKPLDVEKIVKCVYGRGTLVFLFSKIEDIEKLISPENSHFIKSRFMRRLGATFKSCPCCAILDDKLNVKIFPRNGTNVSENEVLSYNVAKLGDLPQISPGDEDNMVDLKPFACLPCSTVDQAKFLMQCLETLKKKCPYSTISASSPTGRGKSAALGLSIAGAIEMKYSSIFISSLNFDNVLFVFKFLLKGLKALEYKEDKDFDVIKFANPNFKTSVWGLNIFKDHPQKVRFIFPGEVENQLEQAELVVIDEAAAIPLPLLKKLIGPYVVLMVSTTEGCGASGKFLYESMVEEIRRPSYCDNKISPESLFPTSESNSLIRFDLVEPLHYTAGDGAESWLNHTLCLESSLITNLSRGLPVPEQCRLFYVCRDTLFSYEFQAEKFLQQLISLFSCSKREISPDYFLQIADGEDYHIFCLLPPFNSSEKEPYEILCAILVRKVQHIPWDIVHCAPKELEQLHKSFDEWKSQSQEKDFRPMEGIQVVDITTHPTFRKMGYGHQALKLMEEFYRRKCVSLDDNPFVYSSKNESDDTKNNKPPLLLQLTEVEPDRAEYILVSYYLTSQLLKFWKRLEFVPVYITREKNSAQEHLCLMMKGLNSEDISAYLKENFIFFRDYYFTLLRSHLNYFPSSLALNLLICKFSRQIPKEALTKEDIDVFLKPQYMKALEKYNRNFSELHSIKFCIPILAKLYFQNRFIGVDIAMTQQAILLSFGLQHKTIEEIAKDHNLLSTQVHGLLKRIIKNLTMHLNGIIEKAIERTLPVPKINTPFHFNKELNEDEKQIKEKTADISNKLKEMDFSEYAIKGSEDDWEKALHSGRKTLVSIKSLKKAPENIVIPQPKEKKKLKRKK